MSLLELYKVSRKMIGVSAMVLLFGSFPGAFIPGQLLKLENQKNQQAFPEQKQELLTEQNRLVEKKVQERTAELEFKKPPLQESLTEITVSTRLNLSVVNIKTKDNGNGIAPKVADKIFQPFFTTKPSGQGTSLAYN